MSDVPMEEGLPIRLSGKVCLDQSDQPYPISDPDQITMVGNSKTGPDPTSPT